MRFSRYFPALFLFMDLLFLNGVFITANYITFNLHWVQCDCDSSLFIFLNITWIVIFFLARLNNIVREKSVVNYILQILLGLTINLALVFAMWGLIRAYFYPREHLYTYLIFSCLLIGWRVGFIYVLRFYRAKGYNIRNVIIVGYGSIGRDLKRYLVKNPELGYVFKGFFDHNQKPSGVIGSLDDIQAYSITNKVDIIFCCLPKLFEQDVKSLIDFAENNLIRIKLLSDFSKVGNNELKVQKYGNISVLNVSSIPLDKTINRVVKRTFDVLFSSVVMLLIMSWLIPLIGLLIKLESLGPIFFIQNRHGKGNNYFPCWKFRSMVVNEESDSKQATKNDARITKVGGFLRRTSLDELPQFINVFLGNMSVVGPRPHPIPLNDKFSSQIDRFIQRHAVKPGITGLAQAKGFRGETSIFNDMYSRVRLDRFYVKNWSLWFDIKIIVLTIYSIIINNKNAY